MSAFDDGFHRVRTIESVFSHHEEQCANVLPLENRQDVLGVCSRHVVESEQNLRHVDFQSVDDGQKQGEANVENTPNDNKRKTGEDYRRNAGFGDNEADRREGREENERLPQKVFCFYRRLNFFHAAKLMFYEKELPLRRKKF